MRITHDDVFNYHSLPRPGKLEVVPSKPCRTQRDLSMAYTPGVAEPCLAIEKEPEKAYWYTGKGNLVAVVSNGTAVLGLGNIGALAGKPVMEGKGVLFKRFGDVDVFDLELNTTDPDEVVRVCQILEPTFGGINLEDIKAPECFYIEEKLKATLNIPVFHDDQHGTAIISGAALLNALELANKKADQVKVVFNGAGAAGIACAEHWIRLGVRRENIILCDTTGVIYKGRTKGMNPYKERFAVQTDLRTLQEALRGADVFCGLSGANLVSQAMVKSMAGNPIVFAMANPDPEITYEDAVAARSDIIMATGRSDYPNQVNNVLGFPFIFRGALDVRARAINDEMKLAATHALARLAKEDVPDSVCRAYGLEKLGFGRDYIIPKPFDPRVLIWEASAVARAAMETGVAQRKVDIEEYKEELARRLGKSQEVMRAVISKAQQAPKRIVFSEGEEEKILRAAQILIDEGIATPVLIGSTARIREIAEGLNLRLAKAEIVDPDTFPRLEEYVKEVYRLRQRKGITLSEARNQLRNKNALAAMMVYMGDADGFIAGLNQHYPDTIRPALRLIGTRPGVHRVAGIYMLIVKRDIYFFADTTVNIEPTAEDLAGIAVCAADCARRFGVEPRVAMLSFSNFGSTPHPLAEKVSHATELVRKLQPELMVDGEMQADTALCPEIINETYPFSMLRGGANVLVFPNLEAANCAYKLMERIGGAEAIGPILVGMARPVHVLQRGCEVNEIVNMSAIAVVDAQEMHRPQKLATST
ncbi:MAG: NADP-dependent malic enzyme [Acidobacteria bacterium]|nr:NADP-dependent malic enzyme [Acidobacteriota bacterium]